MITQSFQILCVDLNRENLNPSKPLIYTFSRHLTKTFLSFGDHRCVKYTDLQVAAMLNPVKHPHHRVKQIPLLVPGGLIFYPNDLQIRFPSVFRHILFPRLSIVSLHQPKDLSCPAKKQTSGMWSSYCKCF